MSIEPAMGSIEFDPKERNFWTFGDTIQGTLKLQSACDQTVNVKSVQGSVLCEEWVHTVHLEFREHYRGTKSLFPLQKNTIQLDPGTPQDIRFELSLPSHKQKRYPPSFEFKYNNVAWCVKFAIGYSTADSDDLQTAQIEKNFRLCTSTPEDIRPSKQELIQPEFNEFCWAPTGSDFKQLSENSKERLMAPDDLSIKFRIWVSKWGIVQSQAEKGPEIGLRLKTDLSGTKQLLLTGAKIEVIEFMHTYGKDSLLLEKPVIKRDLPITLNEGENDLNMLVEGVRVHGLTEDFKTEWQQLTHSLRLNFKCLLPDSSQEFYITWQLPVSVLSEAEAICA